MSVLAAPVIVLYVGFGTPAPTPVPVPVYGTVAFATLFPPPIGTDTELTSAPALLVGTGTTVTTELPLVLPPNPAPTSPPGPTAVAVLAGAVYGTVTGTAVVLPAIIVETSNTLELGTGLTVTMDDAMGDGEEAVDELPGQYVV